MYVFLLNKYLNHVLLNFGIAFITVLRMGFGRVETKARTICLSAHSYIYIYISVTNFKYLYHPFKVTYSFLSLANFSFLAYPPLSRQLLTYLLYPWGFVSVDWCSVLYWEQSYPFRSSCWIHSILKPDKVGLQHFSTAKIHFLLCG